MIRFIHTADIHFGMENYGSIDPKTGIHSRLLDFQKALNSCIDHAIDQNVDFFLFAGDAYKTANPSPTQQKLLLNCFLRLYKANIPIVMVVGNHDNPLSFGKANTVDIFGDLPLEGFHVFSKPGTMTLHTKSGPVNIVGIPWPSKNNIAINKQYLYKTATELTEHIAQSVSSIIQHFAQQLDPTIPAILMGHLTVSSGIFSGSEKRAVYGTDPIILPSNLAITPFDYVALGHLHRYQNLNESGYPAIVYSGSIERIDFGERKEQKGFCSVSIEKKGETTHSFVPLKTRPFIQIEVKLNAMLDQTQQILDALNHHNLEHAVVKIVYHMPSDQKDTVDLGAIQRACSRASYIAGIIPVYETISRTKRAGLHITMDLPTLLDHYFDQKPELKDNKDHLMQKALQLIQEINNTETEQSP